MFVFDILQIPIQRIQICNGCIAPTYTHLAIGPVYLRSQGKFPPRNKTIISNICLQLLEVCLTVKKVSAHPSSTVFSQICSHLLTSFIFKTRVVHCFKKITVIWKYMIAFTISKAKNVSSTSVTKFKTHVLCIYFRISSNEHSGATQYTYVLASYATSDRARITFPWITSSRFGRWRL
jgi:hypothetical protein